MIATFIFIGLGAVALVVWCCLNVSARQPEPDEHERGGF